MARRTARTISHVGSGALEDYLPRNPTRYGILLSGPSTGLITFVIGKGSGQSITLTPGCAPFFLTRDMIGDTIMEQFQVITSPAAVVVPAMEITEA